MSNVTNVYNGLLEKLAEKFPAKSRIPNPYNLPDNIDNFLIDGFGVKVGPEGQSEFVEFNSFCVNREFTIVFTREMVATSSNTDVPDDISLKLLEDIYEARKMITAPDKMGISSIQKADNGSASGVTEVKAESRKYLSMEVSFNIDINESF